MRPPARPAAAPPFTPRGLTTSEHPKSPPPRKIRNITNQQPDRDGGEQPAAGKWVGWESPQEYKNGWTKHVLGPFAKKTRRLVDRFAPRYLTPSQEKSHTRTGVTCYILSPSCLYVGSLSMCSDDRYEAPTREKLGLVTRLGPLTTFPPAEAGPSPQWVTGARQWLLCCQSL